MYVWCIIFDKRVFSLHMHAYLVFADLIDPKMTDVQRFVVVNLWFCTAGWFADVENGQKFKLSARLNMVIFSPDLRNTHVTQWQPFSSLVENPTGEPCRVKLCLPGDVSYLRNPSIPFHSIPTIPTNYSWTYIYIYIYIYIFLHRYRSMKYIFYICMYWGFLKWGTPQSSSIIYSIFGCSSINQLFWGTPISGNPHIYM